MAAALHVYFQHTTISRNKTIEREGAATMIESIEVHRMFILIRF